MSKIQTQYLHRRQEDAQNLVDFLNLLEARNSAIARHTRGGESGRLELDELACMESSLRKLSAWVNGAKSELQQGVLSGCR